MNAVYREYKYTSQQAVKEFGYDKLSLNVKKAYDNQDYTTEFDFIHCMRPRKERKKERLDFKNMAYESIHVELETETIVKEGGTSQMRYTIPTLDLE